MLGYWSSYAECEQLDYCITSRLCERFCGKCCNDNTVRRVMHELFPEARLYGTQRHPDRFPELHWEEVRSEDEELHEWYCDDLDFTIPRGVDLIAANEDVHFASVLAYHRASGTIHVDDPLGAARAVSLLAWARGASYTRWIGHQRLVQHFDDKRVAIVGVVLELHLAIRLYLHRPVDEVDGNWLTQGYTPGLAAINGRVNGGQVPQLRIVQQ